MNETLPLDPLHALLPLDRPFTRAMARSVGVERPALERMLREGTVRRLVRGAYAAATAPDSIEVRAAAVALALGRESVAVDRTAAWVHGVDVTLLAAGEPRPVESLSPGRGRRSGLGGPRQLSPHDVERIGNLRITTGLRTALDLGRLLRPELALAAMDGLLALGGFTHVGLLAELPRLAGHRGIGQLRALAVQADARSAGLAESVLRLRWHEARLPSAVPGMPVVAGGGLVRLALGVERCRFGAVVAGEVTAAGLVALQGAGWQVLVLGGDRILETDAEVLRRHLECEFHQHLLAEIS